ncbi:MAG TPA: thiamine phosphate synthase [Clostridiales bacterium UBA8153]|nr:thiamine phosphate synthase [Clostridiales bacterium UBA8153]
MKCDRLRLYVVLDRELSRGRGLSHVTELALAGGAGVIQLRGKTWSGLELYREAVALGPLVKSYGALLIINDRVDVALAVQADGVHVGQEDLPAEAVRRLLAPRGVLGVSVGSLEEARAAAKVADYVSVGPVFPTATKPDAGPSVGLDLLRHVAAAVGVPVLAIGGIHAGNVQGCVQAGAAGVAVVSAVVAADDPEEAAAAILRAGWRDAGAGQGCR